jgi:Ca-activated chloride channel homolog
LKFANPWWLAAGLAACVLLTWMWRRYDARQHAALANFVSAHLRHQLTRSISSGRRRVQRGLYLAALACLFVALAGPLVGYRWEQVSRRGNNIMFAIDTSRSMSTPDVKPDRLTRAKLAIDDFAKQLDGDAAGIVAFAGNAFLACPITLDYVAFHESLAAIDTGTIPRGGTNISSAILAAQVALHRRPGSDKILILVTDGEDLEGDALEAARKAAKDGLKIYAVGVGTAAGDLIPISQEMGGGFVKDETGGFVRSRLDEPALKAIAAATGGLYVPLGTQGEGLDLIFHAVNSMEKHGLASRQQRIYIQRYQWPLSASLGFLLASLLIGNRRRSVGSRRTVTGVAAMSVLAIISISSQPAPAASEEGQERATTATSPVHDRKEAVTEYNAGTAAYRAGRYSQAAQAFQQSINQALSSDAKRLADQQDAYYNLGNTLYRTGQKTEQTSPQDTLQKWNEAVKAYDTALQLRADDADSKFNRDLVKRKIDALKQNQDQQNQQQKQNQQQNKNQQQNQNQSQQQGQNQQQNQNQKQDQNQNQQQKQDQHQQNQNQQQNQQNPNQQQNQPQQNGGSGQPPSQPPNSPDAKNDPKQQDQGQPQPPPNGGGSKGNQSPQNAGQSEPPKGEPQRTDEDERGADSQRLPGQMTREEARELLDSVKGDERHAPLVPVEQRNAVQPPEKPFKNW